MLLTAAAAAANAQGTKSDRGAPPSTTQTSPDAVVGQDDPARAPRSSESTEARERPPVGGAPEPTPTPAEPEATPAVEAGGEDTPDTDAPDTDASGLSLEASGETREVRVKGFRWRAAVEQTMLFLSVQHGYAFTQPKTRRDLHGPFFKDYFRSVRSLHGWADGGRFFTNYVAHPMQGSLLGFVQVQNDPAGSRLRLGEPGYWRSRMKALAWSAAWSTQFEIGPLSQASIGNVGMHGKQTYVDVVMTPTAGLGLLVAEDALDRYLIAKLERRTDNRYVRIFSRMVFNPTRTAANLLRFKKPWYRDVGLR